MVLRDMKTVSFTQVINRAIKCKALTQECMFRSMRVGTRDKGLYTAVYRLKPEWLDEHYHLSEDCFSPFFYRDFIKGVCVHCVTPLGFAILLRDKEMENLFVRLGARKEQVIYLLDEDEDSRWLSADELRVFLKRK